MQHGAIFRSGQNYFPTLHTQDFEFVIRLARAQESEKERPELFARCRDQQIEAQKKSIECVDYEIHENECGYCRDLLQLRIINLNTYPKKFNEFTVRVNKNVAIGDIRFVLCFAFQMHPQQFISSIFIFI